MESSKWFTKLDMWFMEKFMQILCIALVRMNLTPFL
jgi:hypothetical protein